MTISSFFSKLEIEWSQIWTVDRIWNTSEIEKKVSNFKNPTLDMKSRQIHFHVDCNNHTVYKYTQWCFTSDWVTPRRMYVYAFAVTSLLTGCQDISIGYENIQNWCVFSERNSYYNRFRRSSPRLIQSKYGEETLLILLEQISMISVPFPSLFKTKEISTDYQYSNEFDPHWVIYSCVSLLD